MKMKALLTAALLGASTLAALPASAQDFRGPPPGPSYHDDGYRDGPRGDVRGGPDWRRSRPSLTIVTQRGAMNLQRDDRLFYAFTAAPYYFRPGFTYQYTDRCNPRGCLVNVYRGHSEYRVDRIFAPFPPRLRADAWGRDDWRRDGWRGDDAPYQRDNRDERRDRDGYDLQGGPRGPGRS